MTLRNPLFEFMPYGAPELLEIQRPNLLRALALASGLAIAVFAMARAVSGMLPPMTTVILPPPVYSPGPSVQPPPIIEPPLARRPVVPTAWSPHPAIPVAVPDFLQPPVESHAPVTDAGDQGRGPGGVVSSEIHGAPPSIVVEEPLPRRGDIIAVDEMPVAVARPVPRYPDMARDANIEGRVYAYMLVGRDGHVVRVEIDDRRSDPVFRDAVLDGAMRWVFRPAFTNGRPVAVWVAETFVFTLH